MLPFLLEQLDYTVMDRIANCQNLFIYLLVCLLLNFLFLQIPFQILFLGQIEGLGVMLQRETLGRLCMVCGVNWLKNGLIILCIVLR